MEQPVIKNGKYEIEIVSMGSEGEGIGRIDGFAIFVEGALVGDTLNVLIVKVKKSYAYGRIIEIIKPSVNRVEPDCISFPRCGGCQIRHMSYSGQLMYKTEKVQQCIEHIGGMQDLKVLPTIGMENPIHFRNKAQFPVGKSGKDMKIGFYAKRSHSIVDLDTCLIQHPITDVILKIVREFLNEFEILPYDEISHKGLVRHILTRVGFSTGEIMVCLVINGKKLPNSNILADRLWEVHGMTSFVLNMNTKKTNVILGDKISVIRGQEFISDCIDDIRFEISPMSFYQVNPIQTKALYQKAVDIAGLSGTENVLDIYCGIGTISLFFAKKAKSVFGVEIIPEAIEDAKHNAIINNITNATFEAGRAEEVIPRLYEKEGYKADVVVVDPPRRGCDTEVLDTIVKMKPEKLVYISCDPATLARDLKMLVENGFTVKEIQPFDQFGGSVHVETCVLLSHKNS